MFTIINMKHFRKITNFLLVFSMGFMTNFYINFITKKMLRNRTKVHKELAKENKIEAKEIIDMISDSDEDE